MTVALLTIGTELSRGEIVDTNAAWLATQLTEAGFVVGRIETVPDELETIVASIRRLATAHRFVVVSGGLGPTTDDLTAEAAARAAGVELTRDATSLQAIKRRVEARGGSLNPGHEKQALIPAGADVLANSDGTAPGFAVRFAETVGYFLPGVPREMKRMFTEQVLPRVRPNAPNTAHQLKLQTYGLGESLLGQKLEGVEAAFPGVTIGYRVHFPEVEVKIHADAATQDEARALAARACAEVRTRLGDVVYGEGDEAFPEIVGRVLRAKGLRLAVAESCTGGLVGHLLTSYPGASDFFCGGVVTYANVAKSRILGVSEDTLRGHGAVSAEVAAEMALGARRVCESDVAVAITGIAGPSGGSDEKPVGLVHWAVAHPGGTVVKHKVFAGDRGEIQTRAAYATLETLRRIVAGLGEV